MSPQRPKSAAARPWRRGTSARQLRIIAGQWRGRHFRFPAGAISPTPDRVRETLFNWLMGRISGVHCLDLFAGSGALGLEALSRGAAAVQFVDNDPVAIHALRELLEQWGATGGAAELCTAERYLARPARPFELVFMDPPFGSTALASAAGRLVAGGWIRPGGLIFVEHARREPLPALPASWHELKSGQAGEVGYHLFEHL
jgi:16S rRNA (guanine966-N2)-methyltransferase